MVPFDSAVDYQCWILLHLKVNLSSLLKHSKQVKTGSVYVHACVCARACVCVCVCVHVCMHARMHVHT